MKSSHSYSPASFLKFLSSLQRCAKKGAFLTAVFTVGLGSTSFGEDTYWLPLKNSTLTETNYVYGIQLPKEFGKTLASKGQSVTHEIDGKTHRFVEVSIDWDTGSKSNPAGNGRVSLQTGKGYGQDWFPSFPELPNDPMVIKVLDDAISSESGNWRGADLRILVSDQDKNPNVTLRIPIQETDQIKARMRKIAETTQQGKYFPNEVKIPKDLEAMRREILTVGNIGRRNPNFRKNNKVANDLSGEMATSSGGLEKIFKNNPTPPYFNDLVLDPKLNEAAQYMAEYYAKTNGNANMPYDRKHDAPGEKWDGAKMDTVGDRVKHFAPDAGSTGEGLAGAISADDAPETWMHTETHYRPWFNIGNDFKGMGLGAARTEKGWYFCKLGGTGVPDKPSEAAVPPKTITKTIPAPAATTPTTAVGTGQVGMAPAARPSDFENTLYLDTVHGRVVIELRPDLAPKHVEQIKALTREGFYDGLVFHRVIDGFMAQTGDPTGTGSGDSDKPNIPSEFSNTQFERGSVAMARTDNPNSANSQFFINFAKTPFLDGKYTIWGHVTEGMEHVDKIAKGEPPANPDKIIKMQVAADAQSNALPLAAGQKLVPGKKYLSPDGKHTLTLQDDNNIVVHRAADGGFVWGLNEQPGVDYQQAATGQMSTAGKFEVLDKTGKVIWSIPDSAVPGGALTLMPDGTPLVSALGSTTPSEREWKVIHTLSHAESVESVDFSPDNKQVVTGCGDGTLWLWDAANGKSSLSEKGHTARVTCVKWSPDGTKFASASDDMSVSIWDAADGGNLHVLSGHTDRVHSLSWSPDGKKLVSSSPDNSIRVWDSSSGASLFIHTIPSSASFLQFPKAEWSPDGSKLAAHTNVDGILVWDDKGLFRGIPNKNPSGWAWSPDSKVIAWGSDSGLNFADFPEQQLSLNLESDSRIESVEWSPDGSKIVTTRIGSRTSGEQDVVEIWNVKNGKVLHKFSAGLTSGISKAWWSPDSGKVATGTTDGSILIWDAVTGKGVATLADPDVGRGAGLRGFSWSSDGKAIASAKGDTTVRISREVPK